MPCQARLTLVAEAIKCKLAELADPAASVTVEREYAPDWLAPDFWKDNANLAADFTGRRAFVFGSRERHEGAKTRRDDENFYDITVVVFELYAAAGLPTTAWVDERVAWVERNVIDRLADARADAQNEAVEDADPLAVEWVSVYSPDLLRQLKLFRSEAVVTYRKVEVP